MPVRTHNRIITLLQQPNEKPKGYDLELEILACISPVGKTSTALIARDLHTITRVVHRHINRFNKLRNGALLLNENRQTVEVMPGFKGIVNTLASNYFSRMYEPNLD